MVFALEIQDKVTQTVDCRQPLKSDVSSEKLDDSTSKDGIACLKPAVLPTNVSTLQE